MSISPAPNEPIAWMGTQMEQLDHVIVTCQTSITLWASNISPLLG